MNFSLNLQQDTLQCVSEKYANFKTVYIKIIGIDFDGIWLQYSEDSRIEFAGFSSHVGLLFINFSSFKPDTENNVNFDGVSSERANFDEVQF